MSKHIIFGCGYVGQYLAKQLQAQGKTLCGIVRSAETLAKLSEQGIDGLIWDPRQAGSTQEQPDFTDSWFYHLAPPPPTGTQDELTQSLLASMAKQGIPKRILYMSTTGVYGDKRGGWVDENTPVNPTTERAKRRWDAEQQIASWCREHGCQYVVLRVPGIYGPGRLSLEGLERGVPIIRAEESNYSNSIHAEDLAMICDVAMQRAPDGALYNATDGASHLTTEFQLLLAQLAGLPAPELISRAEAQVRFPARLLSFMNESRRMGNEKMLKELEINLKYPDYRQALKEILQQSDA